MSTTEADDCAHQMLDIYTQLTRFDPLSSDAEPIHIGGDPARIPPFLVKNLNS
jgi:hypothetical protein